MDGELFLGNMMKHCGDIGSQMRPLLRSLTGFPKPVVMDDYDKSCALYAACGTGDLALVKKLLVLAENASQLVCKLLCLFYSCSASSV